MKILTDSYYFRTQPGVETFYKNTCKKFYNLILLKNEFNYNNIILTRIANHIFYTFTNQKKKKMDITLLICALFLFILAILLYIGKLSNMIAGYNTLSAKEKEQYDEAKLCKILAITLFFTSIVLILGAIKILSFTDTIIISIFILIIGVILGNIIPKK